ncbi:ORF6N domain-containing protein [Cupriavidus sp. 2MCAB6]|uniref:ORF6N domain-containing protein n=1 Tax=Cupriavidus sp. 2MCAB6 TaxID=3232981 RepID=UPI003F927688
MTTPTTAVTPETLAPIVWERQRVITTELLAKLYGATPKQINDNYQNNAERFGAGKHFFRLEGEDLRKFKNYPEINGLVPKHTRQLILWTERGAARHAKMLETDQAWHVFERLEDAYFVPRESAMPTDNEALSTVADRRPLYHGAIELMVTCRMSPPRAYAFINAATGSPSFAKTKKSSVRVGVEFVQHALKGALTRDDLRRLEARGTRLPSQPRQLPLFTAEILLTFEGNTQTNINNS